MVDPTTTTVFESSAAFSSRSVIPTVVNPTTAESNAAVLSSSRPAIAVVEPEEIRDSSGSQSPVAITAGVTVGVLVVAGVAVTAVGVVLCLVVRKRRKATTANGRKRNGTRNYPNATYDGMFSN